MWLPSVGGAAGDGAVVAVFERRFLLVRSRRPGPACTRLVPGVGLAAVVLAAVLMLPSPAIAVFAVGVVAVGAAISAGGGLRR